MQVPIRKSEQNRKFGRRADDFLSAAAIADLEADIARMEKTRPKLVADLTRAREMGDLSENAAYTDAKGKLFGLDRRMAEIKDRLKNAVVIRPGPTSDGAVRLGATVQVKVNGKEKKYTLTGEHEANPSSGNISHHSPLGSALLGMKAGDTVSIKANGKDVDYLIIQVS